jgi:NADH-quinone oxidoreductase subunit H
MKFALFFLAEYSAMITGSAVMVALFLGGWHLPWIDWLIYPHASSQPALGNWGDVLLKFVVFWGKVVLFLFFYMWVRWTLPRFRFDQLMNLAWRGMIPMSLAVLMLTGLVVYAQREYHIAFAPFWILVGNLVVFMVALGILAKRPPKSQNKRVPVPGSRYNPQFADALKREPAVDTAI